MDLVLLRLRQMVSFAPNSGVDKIILASKHTFFEVIVPEEAL
jgi:hypothetical protein